MSGAIRATGAISAPSAEADIAQPKSAPQEEDGDESHVDDWQSREVGKRIRRRTSDVVRSPPNTNVALLEARGIDPGSPVRPESEGISPVQPAEAEEEDGFNICDEYSVWRDWKKEIVNPKPDKGDLIPGVIREEEFEVDDVSWSGWHKEIQEDPATWLVAPKGKLPRDMIPQEIRDNPVQVNKVKAKEITGLYGLGCFKR